MRHEFKPFDKLTLKELFEVYRLRCNVFVVEQNCVYPDVDAHDLEANHLMIWKGEELIGYSRVLPPDGGHPDPRIGRVVVSTGSRGKGFGKHLMTKSIAHTRELYPGRTIVISAQTYLRKFYNDLGFIEQGEVYDEDGIPHMRMKLDPAR